MQENMDVYRYIYVPFKLPNTTHDWDDFMDINK